MFWRSRLAWAGAGGRAALAWAAGYKTSVNGVRPGNVLDINGRLLVVLKATTVKNAQRRAQVTVRRRNPPHQRQPPCVQPCSRGGGGGVCVWRGDAAGAARPADRQQGTGTLSFRRRRGPCVGRAPSDARVYKYSYH
jgi:hypothetical protein